MSADPSVWPTAFKGLPLPRLITKRGDGACGKPLRKEDIDAVYQYIIQSRDNPRLGEILRGTLERFGEHEGKAENGCPVA